MRKKANNQNGSRNHNHNNKHRNKHHRGNSGGHGNSSAKQGKNAMNARDKYENMARDALASGDKVLSERYLQHADHYTRIINSIPQAVNDESPKGKPEAKQDDKAQEKPKAESADEEKERKAPPVQRQEVQPEAPKQAVAAAG